MEQAYQSMIGAIRVEHIRYGVIGSEHKELRGIIRLEQSGVKASGEKMRRIKTEQEHHREREEPRQNRKENRSEKIRAESEKSSAEQSGARSVVHNDAEQG